MQEIRAFPKKFSSRRFRKMSVADQHISKLEDLIRLFVTHLGLPNSGKESLSPRSMTIEDLGDVSDRSDNAADIVFDINNYLVNTSPIESETLRLFVVTEIPRLLLAYQALRFPQILGETSTDLPLKEHLSSFPEIIANTGLFLPVSACLRLIAVSLVDDTAKQTLIDSGGVKTIISHAVDDPLNPLQRECAVFVLKVLTLNFPPGQQAVARFMSSK